MSRCAQIVTYAAPGRYGEPLRCVETAQPNDDLCRRHREQADERDEDARTTDEACAARLGFDSYEAADE